MILVFLVLGALKFNINVFHSLNRNLKYLQKKDTVTLIVGQMRTLIAINFFDN